jgi:hypothetical protein
MRGSEGSKFPNGDMIVQESRPQLPYVDTNHHLKMLEYSVYDVFSCSTNALLF